MRIETGEDGGARGTTDGGAGVGARVFQAVGSELVDIRRPKAGVAGVAADAIRALSVDEEEDGLAGHGFGWIPKQTSLYRMDT